MVSLSRDDRLLLLQFVCAFVWSDLEVHKKEKQFVHRLVKELKLDSDEQAQVELWLQRPPRAEDVDPQKVPIRHRKLFLDTARAVIGADGFIDEAEAETFQLLEDLLTAEPRA